MSNVSTTLHTDRLTLHPLKNEDASDLFALYSDEETMRYMPTPPHSSLAVTQVHISFEIENQLAAHWAIRLNGADEVIGVVNYLGGTSVPGMGYCLRRDHWGQGIVVEACRAVLDYGFDTIGYDRVELWIDRRNTASQRVADKLGFSRKGQLTQRYQHRDQGHTMLTYGLYAHEWSKRPAPDATPSFQSVEPVLLVHDVSKSVEYYCDTLGFRVAFLYGDPPEHAGVTYGDWTGAGVSLQLTQVSAERDLTASNYLFINVGNGIDALYHAYVARGVTVVEAITNKPWAMREFTIKDLNNHVLRFASPI